MSSANLLYGVQINMATLEELRKHIADLFAAAEDKNIISQAAVVSNKIDELEAEQNKEKENYNKLLNDYKDVVLHSSFKPLNNSDTGAAAPISNSFDETKVILRLKARKMMFLLFLLLKMYVTTIRLADKKLKRLFRLIILKERLTVMQERLRNN